MCRTAGPSTERRIRISAGARHARSDAFRRCSKTCPERRLEPTIPGFLELTGYLARFDSACASSPDADRVLTDATADPAFIDAHRSLADVLSPGRAVIHGDCKLNNLLFEAAGNRGRCGAGSGYGNDRSLGLGLRRSGPVGSDGRARSRRPGRAKQRFWRCSRLWHAALPKAAAPRSMHRSWPPHRSTSPSCWASAS